jgi:hypothetical protein
MAIWCCGSPDHCCQPAVAGGLIYADLRIELSTHLALQALFTSRSSGCHCYKLSPFQAHWGRWHCTRFLRLACLFTIHVGSGPSPTSSPVEFFCHCCFYKLSCSWLLGGCHRSCVLQLACLFTVLWGITPPPSLALRAPHPLCYVSFLLLLLIIQFFSPGWGSVCLGDYAYLARGCLWEYGVLLH